MIFVFQDEIGVWGEAPFGEPLRRQRFGKPERKHVYYTRKVCELDEFGCKFGFFESVLKTRYHGLFDCLNIKASISQKKFFLTTLQNFSNFFSKNEELEVKVSHTSACKR